MKKLKILGVRNKDKKCWEIECPICNNLIIKTSIAIDGRCDKCNWEWKGLNAKENHNSRIALIVIE